MAKGGGIGQLPLAYPLDFWKSRKVQRFG